MYAYSAKQRLYELKIKAKKSIRKLIHREEEPVPVEELDLYRCKECGYVSRSIAFLHGHIESHTSVLKTGNVDELMKYVEKLEVKEYETHEVEELDDETI